MRISKYLTQIMGLEAKHGNEARSHKWSRFGPNGGKNVGATEGSLKEVNL